jgi:glycosyltransferase involved in cell wall biosynthesis
MNNTTPCQKMTKNPLLTIAIPTFNRLQSLKITIDSLSSIIEDNRLEVVVTDNCSDDATPIYLKSIENVITYKRNHLNLGIEGNIIQSLLNSSGQYIWLLSDHMTVKSENILDFLTKLEHGLCFDLGYARISAYEDVLNSPYQVQNLNQISSINLGKLVFYMSNISGFTIKQSLLKKSIRYLYRFSSFTYPHLGVFSCLDADSQIVELPILSSFVAHNSYRPSYNQFSSRFIGYVKAVEDVKRLNPNFNWSYSSLKIPLLRRALYRDLIYMLSSENNTIDTNNILFCAQKYPGKTRWFLILCFFISCLQKPLTFVVARKIFNILCPAIYQEIERKNFLADLQLEKE